MSKKLTRSAQESCVTGGLALGLIDLGVRSIANDKLRFEFAFTDAWRDFPARSTFPDIARATGPDPYYQVVTDHAAKLKYLPVAGFTEDSTRWEIRLRRADLYSFDGARHRLEDDSGVPWSHWQTLAGTFDRSYSEA